MAEFKDKIKNLVDSARKEGISDEYIRGYLNFTKTARGKDREIMDRLYAENNVSTSEILYFKNMDSILDELMNTEKNDEIEENKAEEQKDSDKGKTEEEPIDISKLSEKSKKLIWKVDDLTRRIEEEKKPWKKHILAFKVKMLISKIQREIDLNNIRDSYQVKKDELKRTRETRELDGIDNIAGLNAQILRMRREIDSNEEYDVESPYFMYPKKYVQDIGGTGELIDKLKQSQKIESQQAAQRIERISQKREQLQELEDKLMQEQDALSNSKREYNIENAKNSISKNALILKQKMNIFSRIGLFFSNMMEEAKLHRDERKQNSELDAKLKEEEKAMDEEYRKRMKELREEQRKSKEELREEHNRSKEEQQQQQSSDRAADFRAQMEQMAKQGQEEVGAEAKPAEEAKVAEASVETPESQEPEL